MEKQEFERKRLMEVSEVNEKLADAAGYVLECEAAYAARIKETADSIEAADATIIMVSGPSASGKTTSSHKLEHEMKARGHKATVVSLDNYFKNVSDYPKHADGSVDMEHLDALDVERINTDMKQLTETGECEVPIYDFLTGDRSDATMHVQVGDGDIVIIEGIHALNPELTKLVREDAKYGIYVSLRTEYSEDGARVIATRDLRITRRMVRDYFFRGRSVRNTLEMWQRLMDGEEDWIKPFKSEADTMLDTSFPYEPAVFSPVLKDLYEDPDQGGEYREILERLNRLFGKFRSIDAELVPQNSMLREFLGDLEL